MEAIRDPLHCESGPSTAWSTISVNEALPGIMSPLSWSFWNEIGEYAVRGAHYDAGVLPRSELTPPTIPDQRTWAPFYGRVASNITTLRRMADLTPGTSGDSRMSSYFGSADVEGRRTARSRSGTQTLMMLVKLPAHALVLPSRLRRLRTETREWWRQVTDGRRKPASAQARRELVEARARMMEVNRSHLLSAILAEIVYNQVAALAKRAGRADLASPVLGGYGTMEEVDAATALWNVSRGLSTLESFLSEHGFHGPAEGELSSRSWREEQGPLETVVQGLRGLDEAKHPRPGESDRVRIRIEAERELLRLLGPLDRVRARCALLAARRYVPLRQVGKNAFVQLLDVARASARHIGDEMAGRGSLGDRDDIFYLTFAEITGPHRDDWTELVADRKARSDEYAHYVLPDTWIGNPQWQKLDADSGPNEGKAGFHGLGVSPGIIEGRVNLVLDPANADDFLPGDILVCHTTDPSWAIYFLLASAAVIDSGGPMSHGAIVAREMGIPCIINTHVGTQVLRTGSMVRVDGTLGSVEILES